MDLILKRALLVGFLVGVILILINHLDTILYGKVTPIILLKIILTPIVSFYSAKSASREKILKEK